jgi:putative hemolysin
VSGDLPVTGDTIECAGWKFEVTVIDGRRIDKVHARAVSAASAQAVSSNAYPFPDRQLP